MYLVETYSIVSVKVCSSLPYFTFISATFPIPYPPISNHISHSLFPLSPSFPPSPSSPSRTLVYWSGRLACYSNLPNQLLVQLCEMIMTACISDFKAVTSYTQLNYFTRLFFSLIYTVYVLLRKDKRRGADSLCFTTPPLTTLQHHGKLSCCLLGVILGG